MVPGLAELPRPWLVIEDSHANTFAVLSHFHPHLKSGDYLIVEDTAFVLQAYRALERFIAEHPDAYQVDRRYTDLFGYNATFNFNGYLKRV
jgi:cephalosporin hydroxylase